MPEPCDCEFDPYDDEPEEESYHFRRECGRCGEVWYSLHCVHDGAQNPCPECGWMLAGTRTPIDLLFGHRDV